MNAYDTYQEAAVLSADPMRLVQMLYEGALESVGRARHCLLMGDIEGRGHAVSKVSAILAELALSLDQEQGGELSATLAELYDYMQRKLALGHTTQTEAPLIEVEKLLGTLADAWACAAGTQPEVPAELLAAQNGMEAERVCCLC